MRLAENSERPAYPEALFRTATEGEVSLSLAVRSNGRIDSARTRVVRSSHAEFTNSVLAVLPRWRVARGAGAGDQPRVVTIAFAIPPSLGVPVLLLAPDQSRDGGPVYVVTERPLRGPSRLLYREPLADTVFAAVRSAGHSPATGVMRYYSEEKTALVEWTGKVAQAADGKSATQLNGACVVVRRDEGWAVRCRMQQLRAGHSL